MSPSVVPVDAGLMGRFRAAGARIAWRDASVPGGTRPTRTARIAHLNEEEARVESWGRSPRGGMEVDAGPLGALLLLLECDRRAALPRLESREAGVDPMFPQGAIRATWGSREPAPAGPTPRDLVELARYALA